MRFFKYIVPSILTLLLTTLPLLAEEFVFYDFECEQMGMTRSRDALVYAGRDPNIGEDIVFACEGRSCFNRVFWDDGEGNTGVRVRHIYFPRGRVEFIFSFASWRNGEDVPYHSETYAVPLVTCEF